MAQLGRVALGSLATTTNVTDNATKDIQASNVRDQYDNERDSGINIVDDGIYPKDTSGEKNIELTAPPVLSNVGANDLTTRTIVNELIELADTNPNFKNVTVATYTINDEDNGKVLYHDLASSDFKIPLNSTLELFTVNTKDIGTTTISFDVGVTLIDYVGNYLTSWQSTTENIVAIFTRISLNNYKVIELKEPLIEYAPLSFSVSSDAPVSDDLTFKDRINIDVTSLTLHYSLLSVSFETSIDGINYVSSSDLTALQTAINNIGSGVVYTVRAISVYNVGYFGSATVGFSFN